MANFGEIKIGDELRDNDKRQKGRIVTVLDVVYGVGPGQGFIYYHTGKRLATINIDRIFTDGKKRQRGFNLVPRASLDPQKSSYEAPAHDPA